MADFEEISFVIPGYTPETMPLNRLIEYVQQMSLVLGEPESLHLIAVKAGSCAPTFRVPKEVALVAQDKAARVARGDGSKKQLDAFNRMRRMVRRDGAGEARPAVLRSLSRVFLEIPAAPQDSGVLSGVRQPSTVDGQLIRVGGPSEDASMQVQDIEGRILSGFVAKRALAKELAGLLWEPVRLFGDGSWGRTADGEWVIERMLVRSYERLDEESLGVTVERLRGLKVVWPENVAAGLEAEREGAT